MIDGACSFNEWVRSIIKNVITDDFAKTSPQTREKDFS